MPRFVDTTIPEDGRLEASMETSAAAAKVALAARARIVHHPHLKTQRIWCAFDDGKLFLRGQVPNFFFKQLAQEAMLHLVSVRQVVNEIEVVW